MLGVAVVALLLAGPLVGVLVVHGDAVHVLAAGLALELVAQKVAGPQASAAAHVVAALCRRRRDLMVQHQVLLVQRVLELLVVQQVRLQLRKAGGLLRTLNITRLCVCTTTSAAQAS